MEQSEKFISPVALRLLDPDADVLAGPSNLLDWLKGAFPALVDPAAVALRLRDLGEVADAATAVFTASLEGRPPPTPAREALNEAVAAVPTVVRLDGDGSLRREPVARRDDATWLMAEVARSAIELLGGPDRERLRRCPAERCGRWFLADRPNRVWCSDACGNRTRVARHHARRAGSRDAAP
jgi:predicted RNA-binding Zn ribbon-like protein